MSASKSEANVNRPTGVKWQRILERSTKTPGGFVNTAAGLAVVSVVLFTVTLGIFMFEPVRNQLGFPNRESLESLVGSWAIGILVISVIFSGLLKFLERGSQSRLSPSIGDHTEVESNQKELTLERLTQLEKRVENQGQLLSEEERVRVIEALRARLQKEASQSLLDELEARLAQKSLPELSAGTVSRLSSQIQQLTFRGNVNLAIGIMIATFGVLILFFGSSFDTSKSGLLGSAAVLLSDPSSEGASAYDRMALYEAAMLHYLPRIALALLVELFAYFFLRLYRDSLGEVKYFHNELTNVESWHYALQAGRDVSRDSPTATLLIQLMRIDRNSVLEKGQTTAEIERIRADAAVATWKGQQLKQGISSLLRKSRYD